MNKCHKEKCVNWDMKDTFCVESPFVDYGEGKVYLGCYCIRDPALDDLYEPKEEE